VGKIGENYTRDEWRRFRTTLETCGEQVSTGDDIAVSLKAKGVDTPIIAVQDISLVDFGVQYTTHTFRKNFVIENRGKRARRLVWSVVPGAEGPAVTDMFTITPDTVTLEGLKWNSKC
jgi:hypothetical protein